MAVDDKMMADDSTHIEAARRIIVISGFWPRRVSSITGIFVVQQISAFAKAGFRVTVMTPYTIGRGDSDKLSPEELDLNPEQVELRQFPILRFPELISGIPGVIPVNTLLVGLAVRAAIKKIPGKMDDCAGCMVHGMRYLGFSAYVWSRLLKAPIVAVVHGIDPILKKHPATSRFFRKMTRRCEPSIDGIVLVGSPLSRYATKIGFSEAKWKVVPNGTNLPDRSKIKVHRHSTASSHPVRIVSVSNLINCKGVDYNIEALARLKAKVPDLQWEYNIVGDGPERSRLQDLVRERGLADRVSFTGRLDHPYAMQQMMQAEIFSLPSWQEAFGTVYLEAMARGLPVIGCLENGPADIVTHGTDGLLVSPHDIDALTDALERLILDQDLRKHLGMEALKTAQRYSWDQNIATMLNLMGLNKDGHETAS